MILRPLRAALLLSMPCLASAFACATTTRSEFISNDEDAGTPFVPSGGFGDAAPASIVSDVECAAENQQIYVLGTDKGLYRFNPATLTSIHVGWLACPTTSSTFSMAIDRFGTAWVEYVDGRIFKVSTMDARCEPTSFEPGQLGFRPFGMGFAKNDGDQDGETLFASATGLAVLDTASLRLAFRGPFSFGRTELTAIGSELYAFDSASGVIAGVDKATAATKVTHRTSATNENAAFAFAHWGGSFWIFTGKQGGTSAVTQYSPADDTSMVVIPAMTMLVVGAGSSTCAPTKPVK